MAEPEGGNRVKFFEGVEKLLEIWFTRIDGNTKQCDLRNIPRQKLESILKNVHCEVISFLHNDEVDAYVLSESSMFVSRRRFILKTCGSTTPLHCLEPLLMLVEQYAGFNEVQDVFYSRKNFRRPDLQMTPHQSFEQEVALLDTYFKDGVAYCLGKINGECWYLYTLNPLENEENNKRHWNVPEPDQTLEILMSDLDPARMNIFTREESSSAAEATQKSGIGKLIPNMLIDDFLFDPCGYSMNGISKSTRLSESIHSVAKRVDDNDNDLAANTNSVLIELSPLKIACFSEHNTGSLTSVEDPKNRKALDDYIDYVPNTTRYLEEEKDVNDVDWESRIGRCEKGIKGSYMTIHITPEPEFSYASFESNIPQASYKDVIKRVLHTFQPGKFVITLFANKTSPAVESAQELEETSSFGDWIRHDIQYCHFKNYDLTCAFYSKFPS